MAWMFDVVGRDASAPGQHPPNTATRRPFLDLQIAMFGVAGGFFIAAGLGGWLVGWVVASGLTSRLATSLVLCVGLGLGLAGLYLWCGAAAQRVDAPWRTFVGATTGLVAGSTTLLGVGGPIAAAMAWSDPPQPGASGPALLGLWMAFVVVFVALVLLPWATGWLAGRRAQGPAPSGGAGWPLSRTSRAGVGLALVIHGLYGLGLNAQWWGFPDARLATLQGPMLAAHHGTHALVYLVALLSGCVLVGNVVYEALSAGRPHPGHWVLAGMVVTVLGCVLGPLGLWVGVACLVWGAAWATAIVWLPQLRRPAAPAEPTAASAIGASALIAIALAAPALHLANGFWEAASIGGFLTDEAPSTSGTELYQELVWHMLQWQVAAPLLALGCATILLIATPFTRWARGYSPISNAS